MMAGLSMVMDRRKRKDREPNFGSPKVGAPNAVMTLQEAI